MNEIITLGVDIVFLVATGFGRNIFEIADDQISELGCHTKG